MASDDDFFLSDLTECESDESSVPGKGKKPAKKTGWRVKKALQPARATTYSAQSLYGALRVFGAVFSYKPRTQTKSLLVTLILNQSIREVQSLYLWLSLRKAYCHCRHRMARVKPDRDHRLHF